MSCARFLHTAAPVHLAARILALVGLVTPVAALACRYQVPCQEWIAPRDGTSIPANTPVFVGGSLDGGRVVMSNDQQVTWYAAGELTPGTRLALQGTNCAGADAGANVEVLPPQPFPTEVGRLSLEEVGRDLPLNPCDDSGAATVSYRVSLELNPQVAPWLPVSRFFISNSEPRRLLKLTRFGEVIRSADSDAVNVTTATVECSVEPTTIIAFLEIAGREQLDTQTTFTTPCRPRGCSATGAAPLLLSLVLWRRRRNRQ